MKKLIDKIKKLIPFRVHIWWKNFVKNHIIDEVHPDDPNF